MQDRSFLAPFERLWDRVGDFLPNFVAALILFLLGFAFALGMRFLVIKLLNKVNWERVAQRTPALRMLEVGDVRYPILDLIGAIVFWVVILVFTSTAAHALGLTGIELLLDRFVGFLPNLFLAILIVALGSWLGVLAGRFARAFGHSARIPEANLLGTGIQYLVILIAVGTALEQLNIATRFLFGAFLIVLGALGLSFGLAGQKKAREILDRISSAEAGTPETHPEEENP